MTRCWWKFRAVARVSSARALTIHFRYCGSSHRVSHIHRSLTIMVYVVFFCSSVFFTICTLQMIKIYLNCIFSGENLSRFSSERASKVQPARASTLYVKRKVFVRYMFIVIDTLWRSLWVSNVGTNRTPLA